jgi:hypothetical protein
MVKRLSVFVFFCFCSLFAYGQNPDLIITVTGDSIWCRIMDAGVIEIQFRFGSGNIVSIKRADIASFEYNFKSARQDRTLSKDRTDRTTPGYSRFYVALTAGTGSFGSVSFGKTEGFAFLPGIDAAYFFTSWIGVGVKLSAMSGKVDFGERLTYQDRVMFYGPALHGCFGKNRLNMNVCAAVGGINWKLTNQMRSGAPVDDKSITTPGGFFSAGVSYRFAKNLGIGLNVQSLLGTAKDDVVERNPTGAGCTLGLNFRF